MNTFFKQFSKKRLVSISLFSVVVIIGTFYFNDFFPVKYTKAVAQINKIQNNKPIVPKVVPLDTALYDAKMIKLANNPVPPPEKPLATTTTKDGKQVAVKPVKPVEVKPNLWPVKTVYPNAGALLPFNRIVAYYGNFYSTKMGVLGEYKEEEVISRLNIEIKKWEVADPETPVIPAIHYIATTAQGSAGADGKYRLRMPDKEIDKAIALAKKINGIVFLDLQVGLSNVQAEIPVFEKYFKMPEVHLGIDPEFSMKTGKKPGSVIGTMDATDVNFAITYLSKIVKENNLPPKILVVHRFTGPMITNYKNIQPTPEVQVVIDMDGWGIQARKLNTYKEVVYKQPVQFTGFKLFYKNDFREPKSRILTPEEVLKLRPKPIYIQYQ